MACLIYPDHENLLCISNNVVLLSYLSCVYWSSDFNFLQELSLFAFTTWLFVCYRELTYQPISVFHMPSSHVLLTCLSLKGKSLIISSFWFQVRYVRLSFTWTLRGHCWIINWANVDIIIVVFQEIGTTSRKRRGNHCLVEQSEHMQYLLSLTNGHISWCPQTITVTSHLPQEHTIT